MPNGSVVIQILKKIHEIYEKEEKILIIFQLWFENRRFGRPVEMAEIESVPILLKYQSRY